MADDRELTEEERQAILDDESLPLGAWLYLVSRPGFPELERILREMRSGKIPPIKFDE